MSSNKSKSSKPSDGKSSSKNPEQLFTMTGFNRYDQFSRLQELISDEIGLECGNECKDLVMFGKEPEHQKPKKEDYKQDDVHEMEEHEEELKDYRKQLKLHKVNKGKVFIEIKRRCSSPLKHKL